MDIVGYQAIIHITQALPNENLGLVVDPEEKQVLESKRSWLCTPFTESITYGVHFTINNSFSWDFYLFAETEEKANELGEALLLYLRYKYQGVDGVITTIPLYSTFLEIDRPLYELKFPNIPTTEIKFPLLSKLIHYFNSPQRSFNIDMYILWKRFDLGYYPDPFRLLIKFYLTLNPNQMNILHSKPIKSSTSHNSVLRYIISELSLPPHFIIKCEWINSEMWRNILTCNIFPKISEIFPEGMLPQQNVPVEYHRQNPSFHRNNLDFNIPSNLPLPKPPILKNRNVITCPVSNEKGIDAKYVQFGYKMNGGILTSDPATININLLNGHLNLFGKTRTGKSTLGKIIIHGVVEKRPDVGVLIINLVKPNLVKDFPMARVYRFPSKDFKIPYIMYGERIKKAISITSKIMNACLGLKYVGPIIFSETLQRCHQELGKFPASLSRFFKCVEDNVRAQPYDPKFQQRILTALNRRMTEMFQNPELQETLSLTHEEQNNLPEWFTQWRAGKVVFLDLTRCEEREQHLISMYILQMIETFISFQNFSERLKYLVFIDEAHRILGKAKDYDPESAEFIMKTYTNKLFANSIEECGEKGLGFIISEQRPYFLFDCALDSARIRVLFRLGYPNNEIYTGDLEQRELLLSLESRYALVLNENERYLCKTMDDPY